MTGYFDWDGTPAVISRDNAAVLNDLTKRWHIGGADPVIRAEERDCPEVSREELAARYPAADLSVAEALLNWTRQAMMNCLFELARRGRRRLRPC